MMGRIALGPLSFSRMAYGMWRLCDDADTSPRHVQAKIEACLARGITTIDQADIYGGYTSEALLGACLRAAPSLRGQIELVTKCGIVAPVGRHAAARVKYYDTSAAHITASLETSLKDMAVESVELLLIHRQDPFLDPHETGAALDALVASGKVRAVGVSNFRPHDFSLLQSAMRERLVTNQIEISLKCHDPFTNGDVAFLQERAIVPMAWSPLGGGHLLGRDHPALAPLLIRMAGEYDVEPSAIAIAWLMAHPARILPVIGTNQVARIAHLADAAEVVLSRQDWFELYTAALGREVP
jgi:predicted oxidoreductase